MSTVDRQMKLKLSKQKVFFSIKMHRVGDFLEENNGTGRDIV